VYRKNIARLLYSRGKKWELQQQQPSYQYSIFMKKNNVSLSINALLIKN
jgi:hypothetical protein